MRRIVLLVLFASLSTAALAEPAALTYDDIVRRASADPESLSRAALLARFQSDVAATGRVTREGPTLEAEMGPRRMDDGARKLQAVARVEVPFSSGRRERSAAESVLGSAGADVAAAEAVASRFRLRAAYLNAWFEQARLDVIDEQGRAIEQLLATVRKRVDEGAEAPYEAALIEGESLRSRTDSDGGRAALGEAWSTLRALADLPAQPVRLAPPGTPDLSLRDDAAARFEAGLMKRAAAHRGSLDSAFLTLEAAQRRSRWSAAATVAKEADESYATVGAAYRFPLRGESAALARARETATAATDRGAAIEDARLATRFGTAIERARQFGSITAPEAFDEALRAVALRIELGKDRPSLALPVRRQLLEARGAALQRVRDAHLLIAELEALTAGDAP
jgi:hypothetical protein